MTQVLGRKRANLSSRLLRSHPKIVLSLQVHPELGRVPKPVGEPQCGISCDTALTRDDLGDAVCRDMELPCKLSRRYADGFKLMGENLAWVMNRFGHVEPHVIAADERRRLSEIRGSQPRVRDDVRQP